MANIRMEYREYYCELDQEEICGQCFTSCASDLGCRCFHDGKDREGRVPYGDCIHGVIQTSYKGVTAKSYEMEHIVDPYESDEYMLVKIRKTKQSQSLSRQGMKRSRQQSWMVTCR